MGLCYNCGSIKGMIMSTYYGQDFYNTSQVMTPDTSMAIKIQRMKKDFKQQIRIKAAVSKVLRAKESSKACKTERGSALGQR
jgi:hypothetical protein